MRVPRQVASADIIIVNKADVADLSTFSTLKSRVKSINPHAPMHETTRGVIDVGKIIGLDAFRSRSSLLSSDFSQNDQDHSCNHSVAHEHTEQFHKICSLQINLPQLSEVQHGRLDEWVRSVLWESRLPTVHDMEGEGPLGELEVLRTKGFFTTPSGSYVLQGVRELYEITLLKSTDDFSVDGKLVLIGRGMNGVVRSNFNLFVGI
jgi:G3E family GTPase